MGLENNNISVLFNWNNEVLAITIVTLVVIWGFGFYLETKIWPLGILWLKYLLRIIFLATIIIGLGYMPIRLKVNDENIMVSRLFGSLKIPMGEVIEARIISKSDIENSIRRFGSGGLFGYLGLFKSDSLGNYTMYATDLSNLIFIRTNNKKYVFSCSCHKEVVEYVNIRLKQNCNVK